MKILEEIGKRVESAWQACGRDPAAFADIAARAIEQQDLRNNLDPDEALRAVQLADYPEQLGENEYGEPAITFVRGDGFRVEIIFWMDGVAQVHGHGAEGAFYVLAGERLHATHTFQADDGTLRGVRTPGLLLGDTRLDGVELLSPGDLRRIYPGFRSIHSLFFVGRPCVTVSVRALRGDVPFYLYDSRHVLSDLAFPRTSMRRRLRAFEFFVRVHPHERMRMARQVLTRADLLMAHALLSGLRPSLSEDAFGSLVETARERFGDWIDKVMRDAEVHHRRRSLPELLPSCADRGHRIWLGLVWAGADRAMTLRVLEHAFPGEDPRALVDRWMLELCGPASTQLEAALGLRTEDDATALMRALHRTLG